MRKKLKVKILAGFMLLLAMLVLAGTISIVEFIRLSKSVDSLIEDNYKTIEASKSMLDALEREDSGILFLLLGQWNKGRSILALADSSFNASFKIAKDNITETNEDDFIKNIWESYQSYKYIWERPIVDTDKQGNIDWYQNNIHKTFLQAKKAVNDLMTLNQNSLHNEASILRAKSHRAIMPGIVSIIAAIIFSLLLNFFISRYFISPLVRLKDSVKNCTVVNPVLHSNIKSDDEIKRLEEEIKDLIIRFTKVD